MIRIGIDIGGTFTDFVIYDTGSKQISTFKILSDPDNPAKTVLQGLDRLTCEEAYQIVHGSTVATNALLERKGARTALVTTYGFKDVLQIGRQNRPSLYDWTIKPPAPLVPSELRIEVHERVNRYGEILTPLVQSEAEELGDYLSHMNVESIAVCLLFSFLYPNHEKMIAEKLRAKGWLVSVSSEILPVFREYERTSTTVINAYVSPILDRYLSTLEKSRPDARIQIMQSNGGMISISEAKNNGARCILSGPAGGILGACSIGHAVSSESSDKPTEAELKIITFDMGGTSTDVSLINGRPGFTSEGVIGGLPIHLPLMDIHTIGAGGGSIAFVDDGGALRVGPESAGANPGPACYGIGELPTVTDANLVLGRLFPEYFLGGEMPIYPERAFHSLEKLGAKLSMSAVEAAKGVIEVVNAQMERALRVISIEKGHDPRDFSLLSFGGAGGLHAVQLARQMNIPRVIVPKLASTLSAYGMLASDVIKDYVKTVMLPGITSQVSLENLFSPLTEAGINDLRNEGISKRDIEIQRSVDVRYAGQSYELNVPYSSHFLDEYQELHKFTYGYFYPDKAIELVNLRVRAIGKVEPIVLPLETKSNKYRLSELPQNQFVELEQGSKNLPVYKYDKLQPYSEFLGPALIVSADTTILINKHDMVQIDQYLNLIVKLAAEN